MCCNREGVMEFLLVNHPLDCPICDQAGECDLQVCMFVCVHNTDELYTFNFVFIIIYYMVYV